MINVKNIRTPTKFEKADDNLSNDSRFQKVKIYIAHDGENLNNSVFTVEALEQMGETLPYCPILGYVKTNDEEQSDFGGHEVSYKITDNGIEENCGTKAYGFIGEDNDAHIETTGGKNWLVCYGYLWTRFTKSIDIFNSSNGTKGQSMEVQDAEGYVDDQGRVVYTKGTLSGLCILGDGVDPAMSGSTISTVFSTNGAVKEIVQEMIKEFSKERGVKALAEKDKDKEKEQTEKVTDKDKTSTKEVDKKDKNEKVEPQEDDKNKKVTQKVKESAKSKSGKKDKVDDEQDDADDKTNSDDNAKKQNDKEEDPDNNGDDKKNKNLKKSKFEISYDATADQIRLLLNQNDSNEDSDWYSIIDLFDSHVVVRLYSMNVDKDGQYFDIQYQVNNDEVSLGERVVVIPMFVSVAEKQKIESDRQKVVELTDQLKELMSFKEQSENKAKAAELKTYEARLNSKQIEDIKGKFSKLGMEDLKKEIAYNVLMNEQKQTTSGAQTFSRNFKTENQARYGAIEKYFKK